MDVRDINLVFVAKNCARTNGSDTIDGDSVTGVQISAPLEDDGSAAETYIGAGEIVITDSAGVNQATSITKTVPAIKFVQRSANGLNFRSSQLLKGSTIKSYSFIPYAAKSEQRTIIHTIDATLTDHVYMIKIRRIGSEIKELKEPTVKTAYFKSASTGSTAAQIATGLVAYINTNFANDLVLPVTAVVGGASSDAVIITAGAFGFEVGKYKYERLKFVVELVNFDATIVNNMYADLTYNSITYPRATIGAGNYQQVAEAEFFSIMYSGVNRDVMSPAFKRNIVALDYNGTTPNTYDTVVIGWENVQGDFSANVVQPGNITLYLPVEDNGTNQALTLVTTLNSYIATSLGVGSAITLT
ncbi:MAG: hypothetical protein M0R17_04580 [Candidatus Omnitrophica bacterium]|jgi:hypothetical protein|nr:hypothetical protein [Candidatus Omnitrophota bacterium]